MPLRPLKSLEGPRIQSAAKAWLDEIDGALSSPGANRALVCRKKLVDLTFPAYANNWEPAVQDRTLPHATRLALAACAPANITLEPEYYADCNDEKFQRNK